MTIKKQYLSFVFFLLFAITTTAQDRITFSVNSNWNFFKGQALYPDLLSKAGNWERVQIPHSWNKTDVNDDLPGYYRGPGWYTKKITIPAAWRDREIYLLFEGANQATEVFVNKNKVGSHIGGYTGFNINITPMVKFDDLVGNEITVKVDNSYHPDIPPLTGDFTFWGGMYRDISICAVAKTHFELDQYGSKGVFISTPFVNDERASVKVKGVISSKTSREIIVTATISDHGTEIVHRQQRLMAQGNKAFELDFVDFKNPKLWSPATPHLYQVMTTIKDAETGQTIDQLSCPLGFRWFRFDASSGFFLNGKPLKLVGAARHQDYKDMANAVPKEIAINDVRLLKEMGGNFLRIAHYPQDQAVLEACDRLGILTSVEIPVVNAITESVAFTLHCKQMQREMIRQNFNHPSIVIWAYMNEVLLRPPFATDTVRREVYFKHVAKLAQEIENITREEDPGRYTMIPNHGNFNLYNRVGLTKIPMLVGWNLYQGWYSGGLSEFATFLDMHHAQLPDKPLLVTEYGADADRRVHSDHPVRFDKSIEYAINYHQVYLKAMLARPFVAAAIAWNLADFNSEERMETDPHINNKGLLTIDRKPKDSYFFYQANLLSKPFLKIGLSERPIVGGVANDNDLFEQELKVYSNQATVKLTVNGRTLNEQGTVMGIANFKVLLHHGKNTIIASARQGEINIQDQVILLANLLPARLNSKTMPFEELNVNVGCPGYFLSDDTKQLWLPDQAYQAGSWGYLDGKVFRMADTSRLSFGSSKAISGTDMDPVYQTQRTALSGYNFDVPDGKYELTLHFAELLSPEAQKGLAYDLAAKTTSLDSFNERLFKVSINGTEIIHGISNVTELKPGQAVKYSFPLIVNHQAGIKIKFTALKGETILNGIQLKKIY